MAVVNLSEYRGRSSRKQSAMNFGFIQVFRALQQQSFYRDSESVHLWLDLLLGANYQDSTVNDCGRTVVVQRGQVWTSLKSLEQRTGISRQKIRTRLEKFEREGMITRVPGRDGQLVTIINYDDYQSSKPANTPEATADAAISGIATRETEIQNSENFNTRSNTPVNTPEATADGACSEIATQGLTRELTPSNKINNSLTTSDEVVCPPKADKIPPCPHTEIVDLYHKILPELAEVQIWNPKRQSLLRTTWRNSAKHRDLAFWERYFTYVRKSDFLMGRTTGSNGRPFQCSLEWLVNLSNLTKVAERRYHDRKEGHTQ